MWYPRYLVFQRDIPAFLLVGAMALIWLTRTPTPPIQSVNGTYRNACCAPAMLKDGVLLTSTLRVPFELEPMKFGLTARTVTRVDVTAGGITARKTSDVERIVFNESRTGFTLCSAKHCDREYLFVRDRVSKP